MLHKPRILFYTITFALAAFFFAPVTASAAPKCPDTMPNRWCDSFTAKCDSGNRKACSELNRRSRAVDRMQAICKQRRGKHRACGTLKRLFNRKAKMDRNYRPRQVKPPGRVAQVKPPGRVAPGTKMLSPDGTGTEHSGNVGSPSSEQPPDSAMSGLYCTHGEKRQGIPKEQCHNWPGNVSAVGADTHATNPSPVQLNPSYEEGAEFQGLNCKYYVSRDDMPPGTVHGYNHSDYISYSSDKSDLTFKICDDTLAYIPVIDRQAGYLRPLNDSQEGCVNHLRSHAEKDPTWDLPTMVAFCGEKLSFELANCRNDYENSPTPSDYGPITSSSPGPLIHTYVNELRFGPKQDPSCKYSDPLTGLLIKSIDPRGAATQLFCYYTEQSDVEVPIFNKRHGKVLLKRGSC